MPAAASRRASPLPCCPVPPRMATALINSSLVGDGLQAVPSAGTTKRPRRLVRHGLKAVPYVLINSPLVGDSRVSSSLVRDGLQAVPSAGTTKRPRRLVRHGLKAVPYVLINSRASLHHS